MDEHHAPKQSLSEIAHNDVRHAITRGRKRRALPPSRGGSIHLAADGTAPTDRSVTPLQPQPVPYHKRRKTSLIPHADALSDDDSNDEWEEHVHIDEQLVRAAATASVQQPSATKSNLSTVSPSSPTTKPSPQQQPQQQQQLTDHQLKKLQRKLAAQNSKSRQRVHTVHLVLLVAHMLRQDIAADNHLLRALALSIMPPDVWLTPEKDTLKQQLAAFALWMRLHFHTSVFVTQNGPHRPHNSFKRLCNVAERLIACAQRCKGDIIDVATIACALVRAHGLRCRLVLALQPVPTRAIRTGNKEQQLNVRHQLVQASVNDMSESCLFAWIEVWCTHQNTWIVVDVYGGQVSERFSGQVIEHSLQRIPSYDHNVMQSHNVQHTPSKTASTPRRSRRCKKQSNAQEDAPIRHLKQDCFAHVVAVEKGMLRDVSRRYVRNWLQVDACRAKRKLFDNVLNNLSSPCCSDRDEALQHESQEFESLTAEEKVPTTLTAVQKHPRFVLERHVKRYEVIWPKQPIVGYIKDEPVFLRANVKLLHTKDRWIREMREVKIGSKPMKSVKSKNGTDSQVHLFGEWQTQALVIPPCKDGKVPRGQHGNVDLWTPDHLPGGAEHINAPHAKVAATKVGVDCAPAMTGFDVRGGRSVPRIEGVVVAAENADLVRDAARELAKLARERAEKREREEALVRWAKLLRAVKAGQRVEKEYGGFDGGSTYESEQKRQGALKAAREKNELTGSQLDTGTSQRQVLTATNSKPKPKKKNHEHEFDEPRHVEGDTWVKSCKICKLEVSFEKL